MGTSWADFRCLIAEQKKIETNVATDRSRFKTCVYQHVYGLLKHACVYMFICKYLLLMKGKQSIHKTAV